ncbi:hypothetical protein GQ457_06G002230 [Hibiscus cannabinus]
MFLVFSSANNSKLQIGCLEKSHRHLLSNYLQQQQQCGTPSANVCSLGTTNPDSLTSKSVSDSVSPNSCPQCLHVSAAGSSGQWFVDTGATHHVTPEASNVHHGTDFSGPGKLLVGDGKGLHISKVGSTVLQACSRELVLHNLLLVPQITKNLLSVSKFAKDNGVYFEFHADRCLVRDNDSSDVLLHGTHTSDGPLTTRDDMELVTVSAGDISVRSPVGSQGNAGQVPNSTENAVQPPVVSTIVDNQESEGVLPLADAAFVGANSGDGGTSDARSSGQSDGDVDRENSSAQVPTEALDFGQEEDAATGLDSSVRMDQGFVSSSSEQPVIEQSSAVQNDAALQPVDNNVNTHPMQTRSKRGIFKSKVYSITLGPKLAPGNVALAASHMEDATSTTDFDGNHSSSHMGMGMDDLVNPAAMVFAFIKDIQVVGCVTSFESLADFAQSFFEPDSRPRLGVLRSSPISDTTPLLQNYTVLEYEEISTGKIIPCHNEPYPYAVYFCHFQPDTVNKVFMVSLGGENGDRVDAVFLCHMDTSAWDAGHISFRLLGVKPGESEICHFFPAYDLVVVPLPW